MRIALDYRNGTITIVAVRTDEYGNHEVARGEGATLETAVKKLVSHFAEMQAATIEALNASGIIRYVALSTGLEGDAS